MSTRDYLGEIMTEITKGSRQLERMKIISSVKGPVAYMMPKDIGKLVVRSSQISGYVPITPSYAKDEIGVDNVKVLMATDNLIKFESFRAKGELEAAHSNLNNTQLPIKKQEIYYIFPIQFDLEIIYLG